jgi:predicted phosphodiesterase
MPGAALNRASIVGGFPAVSRDSPLAVATALPFRGSGPRVTVRGLVRLAVLSDIHGNLPALEAVLADLDHERVDELVCLGDVALGPQPAETVARVRALGCAVVMGNWDAWVLEGFPNAAGEPWKKFVEQGKWWAGKLSAKDSAFIRTFVPRIEIRVGGASVLCFHGSPASYDDMILATTPHDDLLRMLAGFDYPLMLAGHRTSNSLGSSKGRLW